MAERKPVDIGMAGPTHVAWMLPLAIDSAATLLFTLPANTAALAKKVAVAKGLISSPSTTMPAKSCSLSAGEWDMLGI
jgi:hypothetical protein